MPSRSDILTDFAQIVGEHGTQCRIRYFTRSGATANYDDYIALLPSGVDLWISGLPQPLGTSRSNFDSQLLMQGRLQSDDMKVYLKGNIETSGVWRIGIGSPIRAEYAPIDGFATGWLVGGSYAYKKAFVRVLPVGSLQGEFNA